MDKLKMQTVNKADENFEKLKDMFPNAVTETMNENGEVVRAIDKDVLMQEISCKVVDGNEERYQFTWPDKKKSVLLANAPINKTLRPCREESVDFDNTENLYIEGDNLEVLKLLQETYLGKIKVIYIDPPYNTGRNLIYKNDFASSTDEYFANSGQFDIDGNCLVSNTESNGRFHTDWLNMIFARLKLSKQLLREDGIIVLTIDEYEIQTVTMVLNEVFGEQNHLATIVIKNNPSGRSTVTGVSISHEYALFYSRNPETKLGRLPRNDKQIARYKEQDANGLFEWVNFRKHGGYKEDAPTMYYPIYIDKNGKNFRIPKLIWNEQTKEYSILEEPLDNEIVSYPIDENGNARRWKWSLERALQEKNEMSIRLDKDKQYAVYIKSRMKNEGMLPLTVWDDKLYSSTEYGTNFLTSLMGKKYFDYPKSIYAVLDCLRVSLSASDDIILDFFSGSATTAHAVMQLNAEDGGNRKFIMVQLPEETDEESEAYKAGYKNICEIGKERIRRAGKRIIEEGKKAHIDIDKNNLIERKIREDGTFEDKFDLHVTPPVDDLVLNRLDIGFRVLKCDSSNMKDVYYNPTEYESSLFSRLEDNIKEARTPEDLLFQVMLDLGILLSNKIEEKMIADKKVFHVDENYLIACFDENVTEEVITEIAKKKPYYFVMRDSSMASDSVATNYEQIFATYSPDTVRKVL
ncbi:MAG: site-specific DNA-methyltransferase [Clostridium sp.]|nr:site-specific DNA-methyltransferase [Clostridium sp.]